MKLRNRTPSPAPLLGCGLCALWLGFALPALAAHDDRNTEDSNALIMTAEIALQRDDCGRAAADYTAAAQHLSDAKLAERAADVSLECGQFQAAAHAAARWRALAPHDPAPVHAAIRADLGLYRIDDARAAFEDWVKAGGLAGTRGAGGTRPDPTGPAAAAAAVQMLSQESGVPATLAMLRGVKDPALQGGVSQLALASLAFDGWSYREAEQYGLRALSAGAPAGSTQMLLARARAGLGEADQALAAAAAARSAAPKEQPFAEADVLAILGRDREARTALEALRDKPALHMEAQRRLGLLAFNRGDYEEAQRDFTDLLADRDAAAIAVYYLAAIADRRNDPVTALRGYQLLSGTALDAAARDRAAQLLYKQGQRDQALRILQPGSDATPTGRLAAEIQQAELLANNGEADQSLARIDDALARFPDHPDLLYQKAILLEKAGRTNAALAQLEALYRARPEDGAIANALGFLLADHGRELSRAQRLITAALKDEPDNPAILDSMGWLEFKRGNAREALPLLDRAFRLDPDGDIGAHWGEVLWSLGEKASARKAWSRALIADPDNALVREAQKRAGVPQMPSTGTGTSI